MANSVDQALFRDALVSALDASGTGDTAAQVDIAARALAGHYAEPVRAYHNADHIRAPLFVLQGALDMRVVKGESDQIVNRLRALGVSVRYDIYDDEGHGFTKRSNELKAVQDTAEFLEQHLLANRR